MNRELLKDKIEETSQYLKLLGLELPLAVKRRDKREPGRTEKETYEDKTYRVLVRYWRRQKERVQQKLELISIFQKADPSDFGNAFWENEDNELLAQVNKLLTEAAQNGVALFGELQRIGLDYTLANKEASEWATKYAYELVKGINETTRKAIEQAVKDFINIPGFSIGDVVGQLQAVPYSPERAEKIAITEITRAYAQGNQLAGERLKREFPNVKVIKIWFTNADDRVCPICQPLNGKEVLLNKDFVKGIDNPPAHVNCRCWTVVSTRIE